MGTCGPVFNFWFLVYGFSPQNNNNKNTPTLLLVFYLLQSRFHDIADFI